MKVIKLKYAAKCSDCGAELPVGSEAKWYGRGRVYGIGCHDKPEGAGKSRLNGFVHGEPEGLTLSRYDRYGVYSHDGKKLGSTCGCEEFRRIYVATMLLR